MAAFEPLVNLLVLLSALAFGSKFWHDVLDRVYGVPNAVGSAS